MANRSKSKNKLYKEFSRGIISVSKTSHSDFVQEVYRMSRQVNQRFYRLEKKGLERSSDAYKFAQLETGRDKPRYSVNKEKLAKLSYDELYNLAIEIGYKIASKTSTITGVKEVSNKRVDGSINAINEVTGVKLDRDDWIEFLQSGGGQLMNSKYLDSNQIAEDFHRITQSGNVSVKEFIHEYNRFKLIRDDNGLDAMSKSRLAKNFTYDKITRNLNNLLERKSK